MSYKILLTGAAGFIGFHTGLALMSVGHDVYGIDNLNEYYDPKLKHDRLKQLQKASNFQFKNINIANRTDLKDLFEEFKPDIVIHLAAQAGVRYSIENPHAYIDSNITGTLNILEGCRHNDVKNFIFASSSSVYGANSKIPFDEDDGVDHPVSLYAASKKSNEMMAHSYAHLYGIPCTGLRFFTVYGPWGRPDMAYFKFVKSMYEGKTIDVYNHGDMMRDFTYIDDIVDGVTGLIDKPAQPDPNWSSNSPNISSSNAPYRLYNIGNNNPEKLMDLISLIEEETGIKAKINMMDIQAGDVYSTYSNIDKLQNITGFTPKTSLKEGIHKFVTWYKSYYGT